MVYYRTYRPQTIEELDNPRLREVLISIFSRESIPHAFLFTGPKGLGKTSTARIIAKIVNCIGREKGKPLTVKEEKEKLNASRLPVNANIEPCNKCNQCISITNGTNIDVLEIDGASNRGIDEIRDLRDKVKLAPASAKKKVYIIDEVHMLTTEAFNALLKTIEEPPPHVLFIFCTTEPQKVPATIVSRCFHVALIRATPDELVRSLKRIATGEKLNIPDEVLRSIAERADGGFRDGSKILEELVMLHGKKITNEMFEESYQPTAILSYVHTFLQAIIAKDLKKGLEEVTVAQNNGIDIKFFIYQILLDLHQRLLEESTNRPQSLRLTLEEIKELARLFDEAYQQAKYAAIPSLPLELAVVEYCSKAEPDSSVIPARQSASGGEAGIHESPVRVRDDKKIVQNDKEKPTMDTLLKKEKTMQVKAVLGKTPSQQKTAIPSTSTQHHIDSASNDLKALMENIIYKVKPHNHSVAGVLRGCVIESLSGNELIFQTLYKFHKERLEEAGTKDILEKIVKEITGKQVKILVELKA